MKSQQAEQLGPSILSRPAQPRQGTVKESAAICCENCGGGENVTPRIRLCLPCWRILLRSEILDDEIDQTIRVMAEYREAFKLIGNKEPNLGTIPLHKDYASEAVHLKAQRNARRRLQSQFKQRNTRRSHESD